jgi:hypothetical protein
MLSERSALSSATYKLPSLITDQKKERKKMESRNGVSSSYTRQSISREADFFYQTDSRSLLPRDVLLEP